MSVHYLIPKYSVMLGIAKYKSKSLRETVIPFEIVLALPILVTVVYDRVFHKKREKNDKTPPFQFSEMGAFMYYVGILSRSTPINRRIMKMIRHLPSSLSLWFNAAAARSIELENH